MRGQEPLPRTNTYITPAAAPPWGTFAHGTYFESRLPDVWRITHGEGTGREVFPADLPQGPPRAWQEAGDGRPDGEAAVHHPGGRPGGRACVGAPERQHLG